MSLQSKESSG